jgi:transposase
MSKSCVAYPKVREPQRAQSSFHFEMPEDLIPEEHPARLLWTLLGQFDLSPFLAQTESAEGVAGRAVLSPRMKLTLWLYAISDGVGSAREIAERIKSDLAYRWIVGDLTIGHHALSAFRAAHTEAFDTLFTEVVSQLLHRGLIDLAVMGQDGTRVRAAASAPSFRSWGSLLECRQQAALHLKAVLAQADDPELSHAQRARRVAAAKDFQQRVEEAIAACKEQREAHPESVARGSTTDADARVMKMADGGFRPAYNVQYAVVGDKMGGPRTIVSVRVSTIGSDQGSLMPMVAQVEQRLRALPEALIADSGHAKHEDIAMVMACGIKPIVSPPRSPKGATGTSVNRAPAIEQWRAQMTSEESKDLKRQRGALSELVNAQQKGNQGVTQVLVRGATKVLNVMILGAISTNLLQHATSLLGGST